MEEEKEEEDCKQSEVVTERKEDDGEALKSPPIAAPKTPKQDKLNSQISQCTLEIQALKTLLQGPNPRASDREALKLKVVEMNNYTVALKRCRALQRASRKHRKKIAAILNMADKPFRPFPGRPPLEDYKEYSELPNIIVRVAQQFAAADSRRRAELLMLPSTLDDLQAALMKQGIEIKRAALYLRLVPRRANSSHGRRHVRVVPVQLRKPQFSGRKEHVSARFCFAMSRMIRELAS